MDKSAIFEFINTHPVFALATQDGSQPRVRYMTAAFADQRGIIFSTGKCKDIYHQITRHPDVELCFMNKNQQIQIRIQARAQEIHDLPLKESIVEKFDFLKPWIDQVGYEGMAVFTLNQARACIWTMETNSEEKQYIKLD